MHNVVYLAQRRSQQCSCEPNFGGAPRPPWLRHWKSVKFRICVGGLTNRRTNHSTPGAGHEGHTSKRSLTSYFLRRRASDAKQFQCTELCLTTGPTGRLQAEYPPDSALFVFTDVRKTVLEFRCRCSCLCTTGSPETTAIGITARWPLENNLNV